MPETFLDQIDVSRLAAQVGTPFYVYSAEVLRRRIADVRDALAHPQLQPRFAMKACSTRRILEEIRQHDVWIDSVSGNEVVRALRAGFAHGAQPPVVLLSADVLLADWPAVQLDQAEAGRFLSGMRRRVRHADAEHVRVYGPDGRALLGSAHITAGELIADRLLSPLEVQALMPS